MIDWLLHKIGLRTPIYLGLLLTIMTAAVLGFTSLVHDLEDFPIWTISLLALFITWGFSKTRISSKLAALLITLLGAGGIVYHQGGLSSPVSALVGALLELPHQILIWREEGTPPDLTAWINALNELVTRVGVLWSHLTNWLGGLFHGRFEFDKIVTGLLWSLAFWLLMAWATWAFYRLRRPLLGVLPIGGLLAAVLNYGRGQPYMLAPLIGATLLLMGFARYNEQENRWIAKGIDFAEDIFMDIGITSSLTALAVMTVAVIIPSLSIKQVIRFAQSFYQPYQNDTSQVAHSIGLSPQEKPSDFLLDGTNIGGLPRQRLLGSGPELSKNVVMVIKTGELPPIPSADLLQIKPIPYYWRALTFDIYTGSGWQSSSTEEDTYQAGELIVETLPSNTSASRIVHQEVQLTTGTGGVLYVTGSLLTVDNNFKVDWRLPISQAADIFGATTSASSYRADSLFIMPGLAQLQASGSDYPQWVTTRYLQLPTSVPQRVLDLAHELTADAVTPYDKADVIESFLRTYTYTLEIDAPPIDQDVTDYFLFDLKKGYCDYYATAMVVLSRAVGLPARMVSGFATGQYDTPNARYVITEADAHSWAEIYFAGIGWVEFEPTASRPLIQRTTQTTTSTTFPDLKPKPKFKPGDWLRAQPWLDWTAILAGSLLLGTAFWLSSDPWRLGLKAPSHVIEQLYSRLHRRSSRLITLKTGDTPYEFSTRLQERLQTVSQDGLINTVLVNGIRDIQLLTHYYTLSVYSPHPPTPLERKTAIRSWLHLRWRLWLAGRLDKENRKR